MASSNFDCHFAFLLLGFVLFNFLGSLPCASSAGSESKTFSCWYVRVCVRHLPQVIFEGPGIKKPFRSTIENIIDYSLFSMGELQSSDLFFLKPSKPSALPKATKINIFHATRSHKFTPLFVGRYYCLNIPAFVCQRKRKGQIDFSPFSSSPWLVRQEDMTDLCPTTVESNASSATVSWHDGRISSFAVGSW